MTLTLLSWDEFISEAEEFLKISERLQDNWNLYKKNNNEGNSYLIYQQKIPWRERTIELATDTAPPTENEATTLLETSAETSAEISEEITEKTPAKAEDMLQMEYHIVYSVSYQVPVLFFRASRSDGCLLELEQAWSLFCNSAGLSHSSTKLTREDLLSTLTQMEHPVLHKPFLALHPCRTAELLEQAGASRNRVLTFISLMGPFVKLQLSNAYGLDFK